MSLNSLDNKKVFVTGGTGTIGGQVVRRLLEEGCFVVVFSRDQNKQFKMNYDLASKRVSYVNGDICDSDILYRAMYGCDYVVHCAASKHVPLCESNADSATRVNVDGTRNVLNASLEIGVKKYLHISTDKAVNPTSVMGASKFLAERIVLEFAKIFPCSVIRLGNVFASNGSVVPTFRDRIKAKLPLIVNDPNAVRYFISQRECGEFIIDRLKDMQGGEIFIKKMKVMTIQQLAESMIPEVGYPIEYGHLSRGEKSKEILVTKDELPTAYDSGGYITLNSKITNKCDPTVLFFENDEIKAMLKEIK